MRRNQHLNVISINDIKYICVRRSYFFLLCNDGEDHDYIIVNILMFLSLNSVLWNFINKLPICHMKINDVKRIPSMYLTIFFLDN